ncbi:uncharacterized protein LOC143149685 [Ptiloglossa arizonensis]|uniref:uncharacterized protein LOC143149685 n=1 Tax=Ptiloglossa arizonensis TaxID=3350558 RepID=UPI003FA0658D
MVKNAIKVYARLLPDKTRRPRLDYQVYHRPKENVEEDVLFLVSPLQKSKDCPDNRAESWNFSFFRVFEEPATQSDVFDNVARPVLESALDGYNGTIFAYGQTASGKTYSIIGNQRNPDDRGIVPRSLRYLFDVIEKRPENVYSIEVAFMEIYNENGYDLLDRSKREFAVTRLEDLPRVTVQEDENGRLHLKNLTFHGVGNLQEAYELLLTGDHYRVTTETPMNPQSSRSHCIFTIVISKKEFGGNQYARAKVHLVDLAGSERVYKCSISGTTLNEAKHINLSLHYLEQVIVCLGQENAGHIPYRNSCLTSILRDSLGGNCMTTMLATVSISASNTEETLSTCKFAQRVAMIKNDVKLVLETSTESENTLLRLENERLKQQINAITGQTNSRELSADEKRTLDRQIRNYLESSGIVSWDFNLKKVEYCFESFKRTLELSKDPNSCLKKLEHYKDMVVQRDKEISLLIDLLKKERGKKQHSGMEGLCDESRWIEDTKSNLRPMERTSISERDSDETKLNMQRNESGEPSTLCSNGIDENSVKDTSQAIANVLEEKEISGSNRTPLKKLKRRSKCSKSLLRNRVDVSSQDDSSINKPIASDTSKPELACNIVNLILNDTIGNKITGEDTNDKSKDVNQQSLRKGERKLKCEDIRTTAKKSVSARLKALADVKVDTEIDNNFGVQLQTVRTKTPAEETEYSLPFYQRLLNFNVPDNLTKLSSKESFKNESTNLSNESQIQKLKTDLDAQDHGNKLNSSWYGTEVKERDTSRSKHTRDWIRKLRLAERSNFEAKVQDTREEPEVIGVSNNNRDFSTYTRSAGLQNDRKYDASDRLSFRRNVDPLEVTNICKDDEVSIARSTRGTVCTFSNELESNRSRKAGRKSFTESSEKICTSSRGTKREKEVSSRRSGYDKSNDDFENSLPLTGDPEIDEEIIAFYKAKRSGGIY